MKRNLFFWPAISAAVASLVWAGVCGFVIGVPFDVRTGWFRSPALRLGGPRAWRAVVLLQSSVNGLWRMVPYCKVPRSLPEWGPDLGPTEIRLAIIGYDAPGPALAAIRFGPQGAPGNVPGIGLSTGEVLVYVVLMPGVHFALVAFLLALIVSAATRLLFKAIGLPEGARRENGKE